MLNRTPNADVVVTPDADLVGHPVPSGSCASASRAGRRTASASPACDPRRWQADPHRRRPQALAEERKRRGSTPTPARAGGHVTCVQSVIAPIKPSR